MDYSNPLQSSTEELLADLTDAAYRIALKHGFQGSFIRVQLDLWTALRAVLGKEIDVTQLPDFSELDAAETDGDQPGCRRSQGSGQRLKLEGLLCSA
jgi:hypothetical protein